MSSSPVWTKVPFAIDDDRTEETVELDIEFAQPLSEAHGELVLDALEVWLDCGSVQGYRDWDSGVAEGCYDVLTNVLIRLHATVPVEVLDLM